MSDSYINVLGANPNMVQTFDTAEIVQITSIALLKIIRHAQMGIPLEVMGIMLGKFVDKITIEVNDVFAMPQTGTKVSVEAVDPIFQTKMLEMLSQIEKYDIIVGWYHSHPGFGCWLSGVDINTQKSFEQLNRRSIALVLDPIQSTKGNIVLEIFRLQIPFNQHEDNRESSSLESGLKILSKTQSEHGYNKAYYSLHIAFKKNLIEEISMSSVFENAWNISFFSGLSVHFLSQNSAKMIKKIILNFKKLINGPLHRSNNWLTKNFAKINKIKKEIVDFFEILSREAISFCLSQVLHECDLK